MTELLLGDVSQQLRSLRDESIDGVLTDPPFGIRIRGLPWDGKAIAAEARQIKVNEDERWDSPTQTQAACSERWGRKPALRLMLQVGLDFKLRRERLAAGEVRGNSPALETPPPFLRGTVADHTQLAGDPHPGNRSWGAVIAASPVIRIRMDRLPLQ